MWSDTCSLASRARESRTVRLRHKYRTNHFLDRKPGESSNPATSADPENVFRRPTQRFYSLEAASSCSYRAVANASRKTKNWTTASCRLCPSVISASCENHPQCVSNIQDSGGAQGTCSPEVQEDPQSSFAQDSETQCYWFPTQDTR